MRERYVQCRQSLVGDRHLPKGKGLPRGSPAEIGQILLEIYLFLLGRDDHRIGVGLLFEGRDGQVGGVSLDDVV